MELFSNYNPAKHIYLMQQLGNTSMYIDSFLDRSLNATEMALGINSALHGDERYKWFID